MLQRILKAFYRSSIFVILVFNASGENNNFDNHVCNKVGCKTNIYNKDKKNHKELSHYMHPKVCKGSKEELEQKLEYAHSKKNDVDEEVIKDGRYRERYIIFDFETDTSTSSQWPNHVEIDILHVDS